MSKKDEYIEELEKALLFHKFLSLVTFIFFTISFLALIDIKYDDSYENISVKERIDYENEIMLRSKQIINLSEEIILLNTKLEHKQFLMDFYSSEVTKDYSAYDDMLQLYFDQREESYQTLYLLNLCQAGIQE